MEKFIFKKQYGQNFLRDAEVLKKIVENVKVLNNDLIIEIGPGDGALTQLLKNLGVQVLAYEIDENLRDKLDKLKDDNFDYIITDFLKRDISKDLEKYEYKRIIMVANLPYYITTPILEKVMNLNMFDELIIMVQDEVAKRLCAKPSSSDYGAFTVLLNYCFDSSYLFKVGKAAFYPVPNVDSAVIKLVKKERKEIDYSKFKKLVLDSFKFKRKNLKNNLQGYNLSLIESVLEKYGLSLINRAEDMPLECFIELSEKI